MNTSLFKQGSTIDKAIKRARDNAKINPSRLRHEWQDVSLSKEERKGKTLDELKELRIKKLEEQKKNRIKMRKVEQENNMTLLVEKATKRQAKMLKTIKENAD